MLPELPLPEVQVPVEEGVDAVVEPVVVPVAGSLPAPWRTPVAEEAAVVAVLELSEPDEPELEP